MTTVGRLRRFLNLTQLDLYLATGIPLRRISAVERGLAELSETEERILAAFLTGRLETLHITEQATAFNSGMLAG
jgi:hypothetical protein